MNQWVKNPNWNEKDFPKVGDEAMLKGIDTFEYRVKIKVIDLKAREITGIIEGVFASPSGAPVTGGEMNKLINAEVTFIQEFIHDVFKKNE